MISVSEKEFAEIFNKTLYKLKSKVNLEFFDLEWAVYCVKELFIADFVNFVTERNDGNNKPIDSDLLNSRLRSYIVRRKGKEVLLKLISSLIGEERININNSRDTIDLLEKARKQIKKY